MKIGYKVFGQNSLNYGLAYCLYKNKLVAEPVTVATAACYDVVLFSIFWWQHVIDFVEFCDKAKIGKLYNSKTRVVVGGFNACNPVIFKKYGGIERFTGKPAEKPWRLVKINHRDV